MAERFFSDITQNRIRRGIFRDVEELIIAIAADILKKVKRARKALDIG